MLAKSNGGGSSRPHFFRRWYFSTFVIIGIVFSLQVHSLPSDTLFLLGLYTTFVACLLSLPSALKDSRVKWLKILFIAWVLCLAASVSGSQWLSVSWWLFIYMALTPLIALVGSSHLHENNTWNVCRTGLAMAATTCAGWMFIEILFLEMERPLGPFEDHNAPAAFINLAIFPLLAHHWATPNNSRQTYILESFSLFVLFTGLFSTASRAGIGSFLAGLIPMIIVGLVLFGARRRRIVATLGMAIAALTLVANVSPTLGERQLGNLESDDSTSFRIMMWRSTLELYANTPATGTGIGTFPLLYPSARSVEETGSTGNFAHNDYLQILLEGGPALLLCVIVFGAWTTYMASKSFFTLIIRQKEQKQTWEILGISAGLLAIMLQAAVNFIFYVAPVAVSAGLLIGRLTALAHPKERTADSEKPHPGFTRIWFSIFSIPLLFGAVFLMMDFYASHRFRVPERTYDTSMVSTPTYQEALLFRSFHPYDYLSLAYLVKSETREALVNGRNDLGTTWAQFAMNDANRLVSVKSVDCDAVKAKAVLAHVFPELRTLINEEPTAILEKGIEQLPLCFSQYLTLARILREEGDEKRAVEVLEAAIPWMPIRQDDDTSRVSILTMLASLQLERDKPDEAARHAQMALRADPSNGAAKRILRKLDQLQN